MAEEEKPPQEVRPPRTERKRGMFRESDGKISAIRILMLLWGIGLFIVWSSISLYKMEPAIIDGQLLLFASSIVLYKVGQKFGEKK